MIIQYQDGLLRISDDIEVGTFFTDIEEMDIWKINAWNNDGSKPKIRKIYV